MPIIKFTDRWLKAAKPPLDVRVEFHDANIKGLNLRITPNGAMTWSVLYRIPGISTKRRLTVGAYPAVSLAEARTHARAAILAASQGKDPASEKQSMRHAPNFTDLSAEYLKRHASQKKSGHQDARILQRDLLPAWGQRKAHDIKRRDVITLLDSIRDRGAPVMANRTLSLTRKLFNFAVERGILDASPCQQIRATQETPRDRTLTNDEIARLWKNIDTAKLDEKTSLALKMTLVTGQRPGEVTNGEWCEITGDWWTIPSEKVKNGREHRVPLTGIAFKLLARIQNLSKKSRFFFPSPTSNDKPINERALSRAVKRNLSHFGIDPFVPHDLRRTVRTKLAELEVPEIVAERVLNHAAKGIARVYNHHHYDNEKRQALDKWERELRTIIGNTRSFEMDNSKEKIIASPSITAI